MLTTAHTYKVYVMHGFRRTETEHVVRATSHTEARTKALMHYESRRHPKVWRSVVAD